MTPCRMLLTGFEPFAGWPGNPSGDLARNLGDDARLRREGLRTAILPVHRTRSSGALRQLLLEHRPAILVMTGLAAGRREISFERVAVNCWRPPGGRGAGRPVAAAGPDGLFATLPRAASLRALASAGAPVGESWSAGTFACNLVLYEALRWGREGLPGGEAPAWAGFIHVPATAESLPAGRCEPCLPAGLLAASLAALCREMLGAPAGRGRGRRGTRPLRSGRQTR